MKKLISNYSFNAAARTVTLNDYSTVDLEGILLITNVTDNIIIYNFADPTRGGGISSNVITLVYDTTSMSNSDALQIYYDDGSAPDESLLKLTGSYGSIFVTNTSLYTGNYHAIQAVDDCTFTALEASNMDNVGAWVSLSKTLYAGMVLAADFTSVQLASGCAVLYKQ